MNMRAARHPSLYFTVLLVLAVAGVEIAATIRGSQQLQAAGIAPDSASAPVMLYLRISPEQYHMTRLQAAGRLARVVDRTIYMSEISGEQLAGLARERWVLRIKRWDGS